MAQQGKKITTKQKSQVIKSKVKDIDKGVRELAKENNMSVSTISGILNKNLDKLRTESQVIADIIDGDKTILELGGIVEQQHFFDIIERMASGEKLETAETKMLSDIRDKAGKRYTLFAGEATDDKGALKDVSAIEKLNSIVSDK